MLKLLNFFLNHFKLNYWVVEVVYFFEMFRFQDVRVVSCFLWPQDVLARFGWIKLSKLVFN